MSKKDTALTELIKELNEAINMKYVKPELYTEPVVKAFTAARDRAIELLPKEREDMQAAYDYGYNDHVAEVEPNDNYFTENYYQYEQGK